MLDRDIFGLYNIVYVLCCFKVKFVQNVFIFYLGLCTVHIIPILFNIFNLVNALRMI